jgi:glycosyltransferase involved in cell wall biosynthesis
LLEPLSYDVVVPAYNAAATITECLHSIIAQSIAPNAIIVVDDGSTDQTAEIVNGFGSNVRLIRQNNRGPGAATTAGMLACRSTVIATLDADDLWLADKMAVQLAHLKNNHHCDGVFGRLQTFRNSSLNETTEDGWCRTTMAVHRRAIEKVGPVIDPPGRRGEMIDWIARARECGFLFEMLNAVVAYRRIHPASLTYHRSKAADAGYLNVARQAILRRRAKEVGQPKDLP